MPQPKFELPPQYDPHDVEAPLYRRWQERGVFRPRPDGEPYVIVIPPPNVTAILHVGHGLNNIIQDVLIRFERMRGRAAEWLPGTDHAGIATQNVVERLLADEGKTRFDIGREAFVERVWRFVRETGPIILEQLKVIGCSCDWSRTRFTFDEAYSRAVREAFVRLWDERLIYRGHRVIHWCPHCLTALSDEEAESVETSGNLYYIKYPLADGTGSVTVATTRPETMLGDTAVAVHPDDPRGRPYFGKKVRLPIVGLEIPVIGDESVIRDFGTGFVKVTPAHDASDFEIGVRHKLEMPLIMTEDGHMAHPTRVPKQLAGLDRFEARKQIVALLKQQGLLEKVEPHQHAVRHCYRCDTIVEPRLSDQWFVKMQRLAESVLAAYRNDQFQIVPERWHATFENWMENIRDWNISRQLWWGHRIPVFTCVKCKHQWAARTDPTTCPKCRGPVEQDPDVLDTWFSSWLWPFATFGWPDATPDLARFYPGHTLVTAPEILFFWVARMLMSGYHFMHTKPFATVYLHGTVRDTQHRKMSKSLGNGIDPLDVVRLYGADALRWTLIAGSSLGTDVLLDPNDLDTTFAPGRKADELLATASWPTFQPDLVDSELDLAFLRVKQAVEKIRIIRAEYKVPPKARLRASIKPRGRDRRSVFEAESDTIKRLAQVEELTFDGGTKGPVAYAVFGDGSEVSVALEGAIDVQQECRRLSGELTRLDQQLSTLGTKLTNQNFVARAPAEVVAREREKERAWRDQRQALADKLRSLGCS